MRHCLSGGVEAERPPSVTVAVPSPVSPPVMSKQPESKVAPGVTPPTPRVQLSVLANDKTEPIVGIRKVMVKAMSRAWLVPHFGYNDEVKILRTWQLIQLSCKFTLVITGCSRVSEPLPLLEPLVEPVPSVEMGRVASRRASGVMFLPQHSSLEYRWII
jgi:hypothetical protein